MSFLGRLYQKDTNILILSHLWIVFQFIFDVTGPSGLKDWFYLQLSDYEAKPSEGRRLIKSLLVSMLISFLYQFCDSGGPSTIAVFSDNIV